jgi:hypothetical protein
MMNLLNKKKNWFWWHSNHLYEHSFKTQNPAQFGRSIRDWNRVELKKK